MKKSKLDLKSILSYLNQIVESAIPPHFTFVLDLGFRVNDLGQMNGLMGIICPLLTKGRGQCFEVSSVLFVVIETLQAVIEFAGGWNISGSHNASMDLQEKIFRYNFEVGVVQYLVV